VPYLTLHEIFLEREANLVSIKSASPRFSCFAALLADIISHTSRLQIMQIRCLNCVEKIYLQLWYALVFLETNMRSPKWPRKIIYLISDLSAKQAFRGPCILAPWSELDFPYVQIEALNMAHNFGSQHLTIRGHLSPPICIGRS
jgi:hypothetical protein